MINLEKIIINWLLSRDISNDIIEAESKQLTTSIKKAIHEALPKKIAYGFTKNVYGKTHEGINYPDKIIRYTDEQVDVYNEAIQECKLSLQYFFNI